MKITLICTLITLTSVIRAQSKLEIEITNLRNNIGGVVLDLLDENNQSIKGAKSKIEDNKCTIVFNNIENGNYAIRYFHDENSNNALDKNLIGIPQEGFGFSNNAIGNFGPKEFKKWLFTVSGDKKLSMKTYYY